MKVWNTEDPPLPDLAFFDAGDLDGKPVTPRHWLVERLIPGRTVTLLSGDGGTGKSLVSLQLAVAVALGRPWLGRAVSEGPALYISAEDDEDELHRRLADIARAEDFTLADLSGRLTLLSLAGADALLASQVIGGKLAPTPIYDAVNARLVEDPPVLLVLDTLADLFPGNENDRAQARQFVGFLRRLAMRHGSAVLLLAHPSLSGMNSGTGASGSTAWNNSVRSRLYLVRPGSRTGAHEGAQDTDPDARVLTTKKANYGRTGEEIALRWQDGVFVAKGVGTALDRVAQAAKAERVFLKLLAARIAQGRTVSPNPSSSYAPKVFAEHPSAEGVAKRQLQEAMEALLDKGKIRAVKKGPPSRPVTFLETVE